ncbi:hypothetical protein K3495_g15629 [Podosphaera aphanis]|nr:hypothetical protein K3495_g15629 [Podosphaera aphanis]
MGLLDARSKSHISQSIENALLRHEQASTLHLLECFLLGNEHPDAKDATVYPMLIDFIEFPNRTRDKYMPLSNTLRQRIGVADPSDISYWARCKLDKLTTVRSSYSQKKERQNYRCDNTVCYTEVGDGQRCCFGTIWGFLSIDNQVDSSGRDLQFAFIVRWKGVEADLDRQQVTFNNYCGNLDLVSTESIRGLVGVLEEMDEGRGGQQRSFTTRMVIGAYDEVLLSGFAP